MSFDINILDHIPKELPKNLRVDFLTGGKYGGFDSISEREFPAHAYYYSQHSRIPNMVYVPGSVSVDAFQEFLKMGYTIIWSDINYKNGKSVPNVLVLERESVIVKLYFIPDSDSGMARYRHLFYDYEDEEITEKGSAISTMTVSIYFFNKEEIEHLLDLIDTHAIDTSKKSKVSLLISTQSGLSVSEQIIPSKEDLDIELNYGSAFLKTHEKIVERLSQDYGKGLVLLHGEPGTGKTSYIRHLCSKLDKEIIFVPPYLAENISSPDFIPFLLKHTNAILVIEDAERVIVDRDASESNRQGVSNILNLTDGLLSDCLSIKIIATFNTSREKIDKALLRKGRLIAEHKFGRLSQEDTDRLLKTLGKEVSPGSKKQMTLAEIYNLEEELTVVEESRSAIGFRNR